MKPTRTDPAAVRDKFTTTRRELADSLIERDDEIDLALTALVAGEHVLLVGPPGTAKSLLLDAIAGWLDGRRFACLLTKFAQPDEVFGPVSLSGLKEDRFVRVTTGRLPEAEVAFLDEVFKASSAILNTLLRVLNERVFDRGDGSLRPVPLRLCVGASNEWPDAFEGGRELQAVFDRFLVRKHVAPIRSVAGRRRLLWGTDHTPTLSTTVTGDEVDLAREEAAALEWTAEAREALEVILRDLAGEGVIPGDRRQFKAVGVVRASAWLQGADRVEPEHLEVLQHVLWDDPNEQPQKVARVIARVANPAGMRVNALLLEVEEILASTDVKDLARAATSAAKLAEVDRALAVLKSDPRVDKARSYVQAALKDLKLASLAAI